VGSRREMIALYAHMNNKKIKIKKNQMRFKYSKKKKGER
jgi:hypothetical protein